MSERCSIARFLSLDSATMYCTKIKIIHDVTILVILMIVSERQ
jgi:hypothetical protein